MIKKDREAEPRFTGGRGELGGRGGFGGAPAFGGFGGGGGGGGGAPGRQLYVNNVGSPDSAEDIYMDAVMNIRY